jgi:hypothetical protein
MFDCRGYSRLTVGQLKVGVRLSLLSGLAFLLLFAELISGSLIFFMAA